MVHGVAKSWTRLSNFRFTSLSCIGEGNCNPLQCSCLENPRDGGAWWAAVYGVAQGRTRLKRLSGSSTLTGLPMWLSNKESACQCRISLGWEDPWRREWQSTPEFLPEESNGERSLMGYSPWGHRVGHDLATKQRQQHPYKVEVKVCWTYFLAYVSFSLPLSKTSRSRPGICWTRRELQWVLLTRR